MIVRLLAPLRPPGSISPSGRLDKGYGVAGLIRNLSLHYPCGVIKAWSISSVNIFYDECGMGDEDFEKSSSPIPHSS